MDVKASAATAQPGIPRMSTNEQMPLFESWPTVPTLPSTTLQFGEVGPWSSGLSVLVTGRNKLPLGRLIQVPNQPWHSDSNLSRYLRVSEHQAFSVDIEQTKEQVQQITDRIRLVRPESPHSSARILNIRDCKGEVPWGAVYIGRPGRWGNPYRLERDTPEERERVIEEYRQWLWGQIRRGHISIYDLSALHGRDLVCHCAPKPCHGDVLAKAAAWAAGQTQVNGVYGLMCQLGFLIPEECDRLTEIIDAQKWRDDLSRRVQHYGYRYDYTAKTLTEDSYLGVLPDWLQSVAERLHGEGYFEQVPNQVIVNEYLAGQGIAPHIDHTLFGPTVATISLCEPWMMYFTLEGESAKEVMLYVGSLLVLRSDARYRWRHSIAKRSSDRPDPFGSRQIRHRRISVTFRTVPQ